MFHVQHITSLDLPALAPYRTMRRQMEHREQGIFVAEGEKVVRRLLESKFGVLSLLIPAKWLEPLEPLLHARPEMVEVYVAEKPLLEQMTGFSMYQGLLAVGKIPPQPSLEEILSCSTRPWLLVAVDSLTSAENLGALVRNCAAFGAHALIIGETSTSPFLRRAVRSSMGTIFQLPVIELAQNEASRVTHRAPNPQRANLPSLAETLAQLRNMRVHCVAAHPSAPGKTPAQADFKRDCCIVFGSEGYGISKPVRNECDEAVAIPMAPDVDSLNVGAAAAIFLYEAQRQRRAASAERGMRSTE